MAPFFPPFFAEPFPSSRARGLGRFLLLDLLLLDFVSFIDVHLVFAAPSFPRPPSRGLNRLLGILRLLRLLRLLLLLALDRRLGRAASFARSAASSSETPVHRGVAREGHHAVDERLHRVERRLHVRPLAGFHRVHEGVEEQRGVQLALEDAAARLRALRARGDLASGRRLFLLLFGFFFVFLSSFSFSSSSSSSFSFFFAAAALPRLPRGDRGGGFFALASSSSSASFSLIAFFFSLPSSRRDCALLGEGRARPTAAAGLQGRHARHEQHGEVLRDGVDEPVVRLLQRRVRLGGHHRRRGAV